MPSAPIECQHCSREVVSQRPAQAKWCATCRRLKSIIALGASSPGRCIACTAKFYRAERHEKLCPTCAAGLHSPADLLPQPCRICGLANQLGFAQDDLNVCYKCVGERDKATHDKVMRAAIKRLAQLKTDPPRPPALRWQDGRAVV